MECDEIGFVRFSSRLLLSKHSYLLALSLISNVFPYHVNRIHFVNCFAYPYLVGEKLYSVFIVFRIVVKVY